MISQLTTHPRRLIDSKTVASNKNIGTLSQLTSIFPPEISSALSFNTYPAQHLSSLPNILLMILPSPFYVTLTKNL